MSQIAPPPDRIATLDLLRLVAALAVVAFHYLFRGAADEPFLAEGYPQAAPYAIYGYLGVNLFFLISGFVIAASAEGRSWQAFSIARFARIYPGFLICMLLSAVVLAFSGNAALGVTGTQVLGNLLIFAPALGQPFVDGVYWSIVLELVFYGWVAIAIAAGLFCRFKLELVAGWLLLSMLNELVLGSGALRLLLITEYGPYFAAGILLHHITAHGRSAEALLLLAAAFLLSCNTIQLGREWMLVHYGVALPFFDLLAGNAAIHGMLFAAVLLPRLVPSNATVFMFGGITYPLYLLHQNIGYISIDALAPLVGKWGALPIVLGGMIAVSWAVWRYVERPGRHMIVAMLQPVSDRITARFLRNTFAGS